MLESLGVDRYQTVRLVGRGGMGELYEVWDTRLERRVAVKRVHPHVLLRADSEDLVLNEARAAAKIEHPNVVRIYGVEKAGKELLIEMQFIDGQPLNALFLSGPLPATLGVELLKQTLHGLQACHARGIIHCDLKPANMLVNSMGTVFLTDFGIARALRESLDTDPKNDAPVGHWGTPRYSPPEAWGGGSPTPQWDLYAAGVVMYEALAGMAPFQGHTMTDIRQEVMAGPRESVAGLRPDLSAPFAALVDSLMATTPEQRPLTAKAALARLRETPEYLQAMEETLPRDMPLLTPSSPPRATTAPQQAPKTTPWAWLAGAILLAAGGVIALSLLGAFMLRNLQSSPGKPAPDTPLADTAPASNSPAVLLPIPALPEPADLIIQRFSVYFTWDDGVHGKEIWAMHGTSDPVLVDDLNPGKASSDPHNFIIAPNGDLMFVGTTPETGEEIWRLPGWGEGGFSKPELVKDVIPGPMGSTPKLLCGIENRIMFLANTLNEGRELWCSTGKTAQTAMVADLYPGVSDGAFYESRFFPDASGGYWVARPPAENYCGLCRYDFKTNQVTPLCHVTFDANQVAVFKGKAYFRSADPSDFGSELHYYDPSTGTEQLFKDIVEGPGSASPRDLFAWGDKYLFFRANTAENGIEPWVSDGTPEGTHLLKDLEPGKEDSEAFNFIDMGEEVVFRGEESAHGAELWVSDGTEGGTHILADTNPGPGSFDPYSIVRFGDRLVLAGTDGVSGEELWSAMRTGTEWAAHRIADIFPGPESSFPHHLNKIDDQTGVFVAQSSSTSVWLYSLSVLGDSISVTPIMRPKPPQAVSNLHP